MPKYVVRPTTRFLNLADGPEYAGGLRVIRNTGGSSYFLGCCGLAGLEQFNYANFPATWADRAEYLAAIYRELFVHGTAVYALTQDQLTNKLHQELLKLGAVEIAVFPNLYHGPNMIHMFKVNVRNICGRYCDKYGEAYAEPPKDDSEVIPEQNDPTPPTSEFYRMFPGPGARYGRGEYNGVYYEGGYARLPVKPV